MSPKPRATITITLAKESRAERHLAIYNAEPYPDDARRPLIRAECAPGPHRNGRRPCGWIGCRHHLALDVNVNEDPRKPPSISIRREELEDLPETCSLDVADRESGKHISKENGKFLSPVSWRDSGSAVEGNQLGAGCTLAEVAAIMGITRQRAQQIEMTALRKLRAAADPELAIGRVKGPRPSTDGLALGDGNYRMTREDEEDEDDAPMDRRLAWAPGFDDSTKQLALDRAWAAYTRADVPDHSADPEEP